MQQQTFKAWLPNSTCSEPFSTRIDGLLICWQLVAHLLRYGTHAEGSCPEGKTITSCRRGKKYCGVSLSASCNEVSVILAVCSIVLVSSLVLGFCRPFCSSLPVFPNPMPGNVYMDGYPKRHHHHHHHDHHDHQDHQDHQDHDHDDHHQQHQHQHYHDLLRPAADEAILQFLIRTPDGRQNHRPKFASWIVVAQWVPWYQVTSSNPSDLWIVKGGWRICFKTPPGSSFLCKMGTLFPSLGSRQAPEKSLQLRKHHWTGVLTLANDSMLLVYPPVISIALEKSPFRTSWAILYHIYVQFPGDIRCGQALPPFGHPPTFPGVRLCADWRWRGCVNWRTWVLSWAMAIGERERDNQKRGVSWWMYIWPNYFEHWEPFHIIPSQTKGRFKSLLSFDREPHLHILQIFSFLTQQTKNLTSYIIQPVLFPLIVACIPILDDKTRIWYWLNPKFSQ